MLIHHHPQTLGHPLVSDLALTIRLRVVGRGQFPLDTKYSAEFSPERRYELSSAVRHNRIRHAYPSVEMHHKQSSHLFRCGGLMARNRRLALTKATAHHKHRIITMLVLRERTEIHRNVLPWPLRGR